MNKKEFMQKYLAEEGKKNVIALEWVSDFPKSGFLAGKGIGYKVWRESIDSPTYFICVKRTVAEIAIKEISEMAETICKGE